MRVTIPVQNVRAGDRVFHEGRWRRAKAPYQAHPTTVVNYHGGRAVVEPSHHDRRDRVLVGLGFAEFPWGAQVRVWRSDV